MASSPYAGMTVNERLAVAGLLDEWDGAARRRDRACLIALLDSVDLASQSAAIADQVLADPAKYGF